MDLFRLSLINVLITIAYIIPGFILRKMKKVTSDHLPTLSALLVYVGTPVLIVNNFLSLDYSIESLKNMGIYFVITFVLQAVFITIVFLILRKKYENPKFRIMTIAFVLGNVGYFGLPIIKSLFPNEPIVACYSSVNAISMNIIVFTMGVFCVTGDKKYISLKSAFINPALFGFVIAFPLYIFGVKEYISPVVTNALGVVSHSTIFLCMTILGIRLASAPILDIFKNPYVYLSVFGKLVMFPLFCFVAVNWLPIAYTLKASVVVLASTPCASLILNLSEIHKTETKMPANCILLSTVCCFLTIPLITLLL